jgi:hypothetical protein
MHVFRHLDAGSSEQLSARIAVSGSAAHDAPALTRRALLQAAGGLVVASGWGSLDDAHAALP